MIRGGTVTIGRDAFGKALSITRGGSAVSATRSYVYDANQRLCKTLEPESGAKVQAYDAANNVVWRASGLALPNASACDQSSVPAARQIGYGHDLRNRLTSTTYGDGSAGIGRSWTADGKPNTVSSAGSSWTYAYNNQRLLTKETFAHSTGNYESAKVIEAHGHVSSQYYPDGNAVSYGPNALGQPTKVEALGQPPGSGFASAVTYQFIRSGSVADLFSDRLGPARYRASARRTAAWSWVAAPPPRSAAASARPGHACHRAHCRA